MSEETETAETDPTAEEVLASIRKTVADAGDLHRNRARREVFESILAILNGDEPESITASDPESEEEEDSLKAPPLFGPGSGVDAWRQYAEDLGLEVPEGAKRADIVELTQADDENGDEPESITASDPESEEEEDLDPDGAPDNGGDPADLDED